MNGRLAITADWEQLMDGDPEERACFASVGIRFGEIWLSEVYDAYVKRVRSSPLLSAYHLAEWLGWHWWRLRWEPRSKSDGWAFAHRLSNIGEGYLWPNVTVFSDGERTALVSKPTQEQPATPFRYIRDFTAVVPSVEFEGAVDEFIEQVRGQLRGEKIPSTNLDRIWDDVREERKDPEQSRFRKVEALLGFDPDEGDSDLVQTLLRDAATVGEEGMAEVAADAPQGGKPLTLALLADLAKERGFDISPRNTVQVSKEAHLPQAHETPAWKLGASLAEILRKQERLGAEPVSNARLARLVAVSEAVIEDRSSGGHISFALDVGPAAGRLVLRSKWPYGRRFELARILADRISSRDAGRLFPATRAYTYRQKIQRSFAAEFLSPFHAVDEMLAGDYSMENQREVAERFEVSELTIRTLLVNHRRLDREELEEEFESAGNP